MSKVQHSPLDLHRSRLEEPSITRRDFLGLAGLWSAAAGLTLALVGLWRLPKTALLPSPSKKFALRPPAALLPGQPYVVQGRNIAFYRDDKSAWAISLVCTHLGCIIKAGDNGFACPCHGSAFAKDGSVVRGPAPRGLDWFAVRADENGAFLVDEGETVAPGTRVAVSATKGGAKKT